MAIVGLNVISIFKCKHALIKITCLQAETRQNGELPILLPLGVMYALKRPTYVAKQTHIQKIRLLQVCHKQICCNITTVLCLKLLPRCYFSIACQLQSYHKCHTCKPWPIILIVLPIMLLSSAQKCYPLCTTLCS